MGVLARRWVQPGSSSSATRRFLSNRGGSQGSILRVFRFSGLEGLLGGHFLGVLGRLLGGRNGGPLGPPPGGPWRGRGAGNGGEIVSVFSGSPGQPTRPRRSAA